MANSRPPHKPMRGSGLGSGTDAKLKVVKVQFAVRVATLLIVSLKFAEIVNAKDPTPNGVVAENGWLLPPPAVALCYKLVNGPVKVQLIESGKLAVLFTNPHVPDKDRLVLAVVVNTNANVEMPLCTPPGFAASVFASVISPEPVSDFVKAFQF